MNTVDVLRGAKEILSDEGRWCRRGNYAMNRQGHSCATNASAAHEFCGLGAIAHVAGLDAMCGIDTAYNTPAAEALLAAAPVQSAFIHWNDRVATHEELIDAFDRAILSLAPAPQLEPVAA